jgi:hypothetical protein
MWKKNGDDIYFNNGYNSYVGIGTTPTQKLEVFEGCVYAHGPIAGHGRIIMQQDGYNKFEWYPQSSGLGLYDRTNLSYRMKIDNSGKIGIGTVTPSSILTVSGGDVNVLDIGSGIIMKSPNGNCWRITIDNSGTLIRTAITCP